MPQEQESPVYIGRVAESAHCLRLLRKAQTPEGGQRILITGESGSGRTQFLEELARQAHELGFKVLLHHCQRWDIYHPYSTVSGLLRLLLGKSPGWSPRNKETLVKTVAESFPELALDEHEQELLLWLLGASAKSGRASSLDVQSRRGMVAKMFHALLDQMKKRQQYIFLALDDADYSDTLSAGFLMKADMGPGSSFTVTAPAADTLAGHDSFEKIELAPFGEKELALLYRAVSGRELTDKQLAAELLRVTHGLPHRLVELLGQLPLESALPANLSNMLEERPSMGPFDAIVQRLRTLDTNSLAVIKCASVFEDTFPLAVLRRVTGAKFPIKAGMRQLRRERFARIENHRGMQLFRFTHSAVREAAYSLLETEESARIHAAAAAALRRYYARDLDRRLMAIADHYERAGDAENAADTYNRAGANLYRLGAFSAAQKAFEKSEQLFEEKDSRLEALAGLISSLEAQTKIDECVNTAQRLLESNPPDHLRANVFNDLARLHVTTGSVNKAIECAKKGLEIAGECGSYKEQTKACTHLAFALAYTDKLDEALLYGDKSCKLAKHVNELQLTGAALVAHATANVAAGNLLKGKRIYEQAGEVFRKAGHIYNIAVVHVNLGTVFQSSGKLKEAVEYYLRAAQRFDEMGSKASAGISKCNMASALLDLGEYMESLSLTEEILSAYDSAKYPAIQGNALILRGMSLIKTGLPEQGLPLVEKGWQLRQREGRLHDRDIVTEARVEAALLAGDMEKAIEESTDFLKEAGSHKFDLMRYRALLCRLRVLIEAGLLRQAANIVKLLGKADITGFSPYVQATGQALLAQYAAAIGEIAQAERQLRKLLATRRLNRETAARIQLNIGEAALEAGHVIKAKKLLTRARKNYSVLVRAGYRERELHQAEELLART